MPTSIPRTGGEVRVTSAAKFKLRAEGGYVAHGKGTPVLKAFAAGSVTVVATMVDELGRVSEARATTTSL